MWTGVNLVPELMASGLVQQGPLRALPWEGVLDQTADSLDSRWQVMKASSEGRTAAEQWYGNLFTFIIVGSFAAALMNCMNALGRSDTGNSHQVSHAGVKGSAR